MAPRARAVSSIEADEALVERVERRAKKALNFLGVIDGAFLGLVDRRGGERGASIWTRGLERAAGAIEAGEEGGGERPFSPAMALYCCAGGSMVRRRDERRVYDDRRLQNPSSRAPIRACCPTILETENRSNKVRVSRI